MRVSFSNSRNRWLIGIGVIAVGAGVTAKNVISYPTECTPVHPTELSQLIRTRLSFD